MSEPWPFFGYAPGYYEIKCYSCGESAQAAKRAFHCLPCAVIASQKNSTAYLDALTIAWDALKPFAEVADQYHDDDDDHHEVWMDAGPEKVIRGSFKLEHYRRARDAYGSLFNKPEGK